MDIDINLILSNIPHSVTSLILFGSYARNEQNENSDIDILLVTSNRIKSFNINKYNITVYTINQLEKMAKEGSLFVLHLIKESKLLFGIDIVPTLIEHFHKPDNYEAYREMIIEAVDLLDVTEEFYAKMKSKFYTLLQYLLRSYMYSLCIDQKFINFSIEKAMTFLGHTQLLQIFNKNGSPVNYFDFIRYRKEFELILNKTCFNKYLSTEALIINSYPNFKLTFILGLRLLNENQHILDYEGIIIEDETLHCNW